MYHRLPPAIRGLAATLRGSYLRSVRYGPETDRLAEEFLQRDRWTTEQWRRWREDRLKEILGHAATRVPYYREQWGERRKRGDESSWDLLENWPILAKEALRRQPEAFLADGADRKKMQEVSTSGTTGKPLKLWRSRRTNLLYYAAFEARIRRWAGLTRDDRWAILGGQLVTPVEQKQPPYWVWNGALRQLYMSSYHLSSQSVPDYLDALRRHEVQYLWGYASSLHSLAIGVLEGGQAPPALKVAFSNAEPLLDHQRELIARAFGCPVRNTYGMAELAVGASECELGTMHLWPDAGVLECQAREEDRPVGEGEIGRFICTGFLNEDMPLIRYEIGDSGTLAVDEHPCPCGRTLPALGSVEGRLDDVIVTPDGRRIGRLDPVFKGDFPIREAQIVQTTREALVVRYIPTPEFADHHARSLVRRIRDRVGEMDIRLEAVESIPRSANGKFRAVISQLTPDSDSTPA